MTVLPFRRRVSLVLVLAVVGACSDTGPRVYTAQPYDAEAQCLGEYEAIGLVEAGELSAGCEPTCLDVGGVLYVSTVCRPFPDGATELAPAESEECAVALVSAVCE